MFCFVLFSSNSMLSFFFLIIKVVEDDDTDIKWVGIGNTAGIKTGEREEKDEVYDLFLNFFFSFIYHPPASSLQER